jgi:hypothetical protein
MTKTTYAADRTALLIDEWTCFDAARRAISNKFRNSVPAPRYGIGACAPA